MKNLEKTLLGIIIGMVFCIIIFTLTSCSSTKHGCYDTHGLIGYK